MKRTTIKGLLALSLIIAVPFITKKWENSSDVVAPSFAKLASAPHCGPDSLSKADVDKTMQRFAVAGDNHSVNSDAALARGMASLPPHVRELFANHGIKIGAPPASDETPGDSYGRPASVLKIVGTSGKNLIISPDLDLSSTVANKKVSPISEKQIVRGFEESLLPSSLWLTFSVLWKTDPDSMILKETEVSASNVFSQMSAKLASLMNFSVSEQAFYLSEFPGSGVMDPSFSRRNLVLVATNVYCSRETYDRLGAQQPEALNYFQSEFLCALGKPVHWDDTKYSSICPNIK